MNPMLRVRRSAAFALPLLLGGAASAAAQAPAPPFAARVDSLAMAPIQRGEAAGLVIFAVRGRDTLVARGYGRADVENDVPMTAEHVFQIASITKQFTAAALLTLVAEGRVELDAPVTRYLPGAPVQGRLVTVRQLLSHTGGIADYAESPRLPQVRRLDLPPDSLMALIAGTPFYFAPGEQMRYSNTGFSLTGQLIEAVSGVPYAQFVTERVLRPAGAAHAHFCAPHRLVPRRARGYALRPDGMAPADFISPHLPWAAGGFCATAGDLAAWNRALHGGGGLLPDPAYAEMVRPATLADGRALRYGLGLSLWPIGGRRAYHHGGDIDGFTSYTAYFPDDSLNVTVLVNTQGPARPDALLAEVADAILGARPAFPPPPPPADLAALAGRYGDDVEVEVAGAGADAALRLKRGPMPPAELRYEEAETWTDGRNRYTFVPAAAAVPAAIWADLGVAYAQWPRVP